MQRIFKTNPVLTIINSYLVDSPQPSTISYLWNFGVRPVRVVVNWMCLDSYSSLTQYTLSNTAWISQRNTVISPNKEMVRIAVTEWIEKWGLPLTVTNLSEKSNVQADELDTQYCNFFQWYNPKQNIAVILCLSIWKLRYPYDSQQDIQCTNKVSLLIWYTDKMCRSIRKLIAQGAKGLETLNVTINKPGERIAYDLPNGLCDVGGSVLVDEGKSMKGTSLEDPNENEPDGPKKGNKSKTKPKITKPRTTKTKAEKSKDVKLKTEKLKVTKPKPEIPDRHETPKPKAKKPKASKSNESKLKTKESKAKGSKAVVPSSEFTSLKSQMELLNKFKHGRYFRIMDIITNPTFLINCYELIKGRPGNMTPGTDRTTLDGINLDYFIKLSLELKSGTFKFNPSREVIIPKSTPGKFRYLAVGSPRDKIVQKALELVLQEIWEPKFKNSSHGFRPMRSIHSALLKLYLIGAKFTWVIQGDIAKCFDSIPHKIIMNNLKKDIGDPLFLQYVSKYLKAGVKTKNGKIKYTDVGTPQGGVLSPLLANIVLHILDEYMEKFKEKFDIGKTKRDNPAYSKIRYQIIKTEDEKLLRKLRMELRKIPTRYPMDPNFKRVEYVRYADDFVILIEGSKNDATMIKNNVKAVLDQRCGLTLNEEKTTITTLKDGKFLFLGATIKKLKKNTTYLTKVNRKGKNLRVASARRLLIGAPIWLLLNKMKESGFIKQNRLGKTVPISKTSIMNLSHYEIIRFYNSKIHGILNFYSFASNLNSLRYILYLLQMSCAITLSRKYKLASFATAFKKFGKCLICPETKVKLYKPETLKVSHNFKNNGVTDPFNALSINWSNRLTDTSFGKVCLLCGSSSKVEMHHIRSVKDVRQKMRTGNSTYAIWRGGMARKQVPICKYHHQLLHSGGLSASDIRIISQYK